MSFYKIDLTVHNIPLEFSRRGDKWIMVAFMNTGYSLKELLKLNLVRIHQQVLFLFDVLGADGKIIGKRYRAPRDLDTTWSTLKFPNEAPTTAHFKLWNEALKQIAHMGRIRDRLGQLQPAGHKIWEWRYDDSSDVLYHKKKARNGHLPEVAYSTPYGVKPIHPHKN